jgi:hypothetical protein
MNRAPGLTFSLSPVSKVRSAREQAKLKRHVEAREPFSASSAVREMIVVFGKSFHLRGNGNEGSPMEVLFAISEEDYHERPSGATKSIRAC